jgi:Protein of unknown function (DUF2867)
MRVVRRAAVPDIAREVVTLGPADYVDAWTLDAGDHQSSAEQWARLTFEGAARPIRWFLVAAWWLILGVRLSSRPSPTRILGWRIVNQRPEWVLIELEASMLTAQQVFWIDGSRLVQSTSVRYKRRLASYVWPAVSVIHCQLIQYLLRRAVSHQ